MTKNIALKIILIVQSFSPLFLILLIKYFDVETLCLCKSFFEEILYAPLSAITKTLKHSAIPELLIEFFSFIWVLYSLYTLFYFFATQTANFSSEGESLVDIERISDSRVTFFMTFVLPMTMDDLNTWKGLFVFVIIMVMIFVLMWKTTLYYQNPVLTFLGYEVFSFKFETTKLAEFRDKRCIGISRSLISKGTTIKRQWITDNVFLIFKDK